MVQALRELISRGALGRIHTVSAAWLNEELLTIEPGHWMLDPEQMGPSLSLADVGVHCWDLIEHVTAGKIVDVLCETRAARPGAAGSEDTALLLMRLGEGTLASATISQAAPGHGNTVTLEVIGDRASASWDIRSANQLTVSELGGAGRVLERATAPVEALGVAARLPPGQPEGHSEALAVLFGRIHEHIRGGARVSGHPTFADGVRGLHVLEALLRSTAEGRWIAVERD
jgi:predicted dehydrogenase